MRDATRSSLSVVGLVMLLAGCTTNLGVPSLPLGALGTSPTAGSPSAKPTASPGPSASSSATPGPSGSTSLLPSPTPDSTQPGQVSLTSNDAHNRWLLAAPLLEPRVGPYLAVVDDALMAFGGGGVLRDEWYDESSGAWQPKRAAGMTDGLNGYMWSGGVIGGTVALVGGTQGYSEGGVMGLAFAPVPNPEEPPVTCQLTYAGYDSAWGVSAAAIDGALVVAGGRYSNYVTGSTYRFDSLTPERYDNGQPQRDATQEEDMLRACAAGAGTGHAGALYVAGGYSLADDGAMSVFRRVQVYRLADDMWLSDSDAAVPPPMPTARYGAGAAWLNDRLFVIGGYDESGHVLDTVECFDPALRSWSTCAALVQARACAGVAAYRGRLVVAGGVESQSHACRSVEVYAP